MTKNTKSKEQDNSGDDLDFYDFLEIVTDKFDSITHQSIEKNVDSFLKIFFSIVEERKADSRQRWQQKINEVDEQKRLLKTQLENRISVLSKNLKKPTFIQIRDKIIFTIGVANACFSPLIGII
jgi:hypothetical protein